MRHTLLAIIFILICSYVISKDCNSSLTMEIVAEFVEVDFLWDDDHKKVEYELKGLYKSHNNAITGVKVDADGNIYVTVPRWKSGVPATLNQLVKVNDKFVLSPWPSWDFQTVGETGKLQNCQSMTIDSEGNMWIIETGRRNFDDIISSKTVDGPAGFFKVDIKTKEILQSYYFPEDVVPYDSSFINDIVLDDIGGFAFFTNTMGNGGIVTYNMATNQSKMFTAVSTQRNSSYDFCVDGKSYGTNSGVGSSPSDGIAINNDGSVLYWSPVQGEGMKAGQSDGMIINGNTLFFGSIKDSALGRIENIDLFTSSMSLSSDDSSLSPISSDNLRWIDTLSLDLNSYTQENGNKASSLYLTSNKLDLFFSFKMDFSGKSGSNFRIIKINLD